MDVLKLMQDNPMQPGESVMGYARRLSKKYGCHTQSVRKQYYKLKKRNEHQALYAQAESVGFNADEVGHYWYKSKHISAHVKPEKISYENLRDDLIRELSAYSPIFPKIDHPVNTDPHLLVIDPADVHIGKLANEFGTGDRYNSDIAIKRVIEGVLGVLRKARGYEIDQILFVAGNDIIHTDNTKRTTTNGTPQDTDGMWYDNFMDAKDLYIRVIELLLNYAPVHYCFNPSNHDFVQGLLLSDVIHTYFRNHPNMTFDVDLKHRKYYTYGVNLIGTTHGDGAKQADLPLLAANESEDWSKCKHRYIYTHHVHHKNSKDYPGVTVESLRSPSGADYWHHKAGYQHAPKAIEGFLHHPEFGQVARFTHLF
jgi:hypothetical protein